MILPEDQQTIEMMVGRDAIDYLNPPTAFVNEYLLRLGMLSRAGRPGCLGAVELMHLLRQFKIKPVGKQQTVAVSDWSRIPPDTIIYCEGRRGTFIQTSGDGMVLIRFDGYRGQNEVPSRMVTVSEKIVEGMEDDAFEAEPDPEAAKLSSAVFLKWNGIEAGAPVTVKSGNRVLEAEFVDVEDSTNLIVVVKGKRSLVDASFVTLLSELEEPAPA